MTIRIQQIFAGAVIGASLLTGLILVVPPIISVQSTPSVTVVPPASDTTPVDVAFAADTSVDMNHWQETAKQPTPYVPGKPRKGK